MRYQAVNCVLLIASIGCTAIAAYHLALGVPLADPWLFPMLVLLPALLALGFAFALLLPRHVRLTLVLVLLSISIGTYAVDAPLELLPEAHELTPRERLAMRVPGADDRTAVQVAADLRAAGTDASAALPANLLRALSTTGRAPRAGGRDDLIPLALIRNHTFVHCNESGRYALFRTDEMGFNNPRGTWTRPADLALVGDSFIEGACVDSNATLPANIRLVHPRTLALGLDGAGPLSELGLIREYLPRVRPTTVLWFYYEGNDLSDLTSELRVPRLRAYLLGRDQGLIEHAAELDSSLTEGYRHFAHEDVARATPAVSAMSRIGHWARLSALRRDLALGGVAERLAACCDVDSFGRVLREADLTARGWGGHLYVVYLPAPGRFLRPMSGVFTDELRQRGRVLRRLHELRIPVIDLYPDFAAAPNRQELFFDAASHYTPAGYALAAAAVVRHLSAPEQ